MKQFLFFLATISLFIGCTKDNSEDFAPPCETENWGTLCITNSTLNPAKIWINGYYIGILSSNQEKCVTKVPAGNARVQGEQASGYIFYPKEWDNNKQVNKCAFNHLTIRE